jgi:hypothetical protein
MKCKKCKKPIKEDTDGDLRYCQGHDLLRNGKAVIAVQTLTFEVNIILLRKQRDWLVHYTTNMESCDVPPEVDGLINLLDYMLDKAEGYE